MPKRILYVEQNIDGTVGGSHKVVIDLLTRLSDRYEPVVLFYEENTWADYLRERGYEVHVWDGKSEYQQGRKLGKVGTVRRMIGGGAKRRRFLKDQRIDAIHLNNAPFVGTEVWLPAAKMLGIPIMTYAHGWGPQPGPFDRMLQQRYDYVFPVSLVVDETLEAAGIDAGKRVLTYPGIDSNALREREYRDPAEVRAEFGLEDGQLLALMVGNVREWKGQAVVVEAVSRLAPELRERIHILMVGPIEEELASADADYAAPVRAEIERLGLTDTIELTGRRTDVPDLMEAADIGIHASLKPEPFGLVVLEAMAHGCAVVADRRGGPAEMITEGSGIHFDSARPEELTAALGRLIADEGLRRSISDAARVRAEEFDQSRHVEIFEETYAKVFGFDEPSA